MNRRFIPTDEQAAAIGTPDHPTLRAGAGSGKTEVLARRFIALIAGDIEGIAPISPERMAAIVFGELAAVDLRARIVKVFDERIAETPPGPPCAALRAARRMLPLARISTIHAFCARILRENPLAAGLDPGFTVLDEFASGTFLEHEARRALIDAVRDPDSSPGARLLVAARGMDGGEYRAGAVGVALEIAGRLARLNHPPEWLVEKAREFAAREPEMRAELAMRADATMQLAETLLGAEVGGAAGERIAQSRRIWPVARAALQLISDDNDGGGRDGEWETLSDFVAALPDARNHTIKEHVIALRQLLPAKDKLNGGLAEAWGALRAIEPTRQIAATIAQAARRLDDVRRRERVVTFDDLLILARRMLEARPDVANRYRSALDALLVDEYQDTDPLQHEIIELLARPAPAAPALFVVGDEKQSIFGFRNADVTVFKRRIEAASNLLPLRGNLRSTANILGFVNAFGPHLMRPPGDLKPWWAIWSDDHALRALRTDGFNPPIELIVTPANGKDDDADHPGDERVKEANAIAARIGKLLDSGAPVFDAELKRERPARPGDIAILLRAFTNVALYENALTRAGIPNYTVRGRGFFGCPEIADLTELLAAIDDPENSLALAAALRSPLFALSDRCLFEMLHPANGDGQAPASLARIFAGDAPTAFRSLSSDAAAAEAAWRTLKELREMRGRAAIVALIERALALTDFEAVLLGLDRGRQRVANLRKLIELARRFESREFFSLRDFVAHLRRLAESEPREPQAQILGADEDVVRLMTVHQAKGLEFPIVFVADLARRPKTTNYPIALSPADGLLVPATIGAGAEDLPHAQLAEFRKEAADRDAAERARLFYVALTRARDRLILSEGKCHRHKPAANTWAGQLRAFLGANAIDVAAFAESGEAERSASIAGVAISLRRPACEPLEIPAPARTADAAARTELARLAEARLNFTAPRGGDLIVNPSALEDFDRCPRQYYFRRTLELPEAPLETAAESGAGADATTLGIAVHAILESLDLSAPAAARAAQADRKIAEIGAAHHLPPDAQAELARDLRRYLAAPESQPPANAQIDRELPFFMLAGGGDPAIFIRGRIDLLIDDGRRALVRDYKYARPAGNGGEYALVGQCYALAAHAARPDRAVAADVVYLRGRVHRVAIELPPLERIRERIIALGRAIVDAARNRAWPRGPANERACRRLGCGYVGRCWRGGD